MTCVGDKTSQEQSNDRITAGMLWIRLSVCRMGITPLCLGYTPLSRILSKPVRGGLPNIPRGQKL